METNHWQRILGRKIDRRSAMGGAAALGVGAAAISLVGCGDDSGKSGTGASPAATAAVTATPAGTPTPSVDDARKAIEALYTKWSDRVWNGGELDLVKDCAAPQYARHDFKGDRTVTPEAYAAEIATTRETITGLKLTNHFVTVNPPYLFSRWSITGTVKANGAPFLITGLQLYRIEGGKLAETWAVQQSTKWPETPA